MPDSDTRTQSILLRIAFFGLLILIIWAPMPFGSHVLWAESLLEIMIFGLAALVLIGSLSERHRPYPNLVRSRVVIALWIAWLLWIAFSVVPWPPGMIERVSPHASALYRDAAEILGRTASDPRISVNRQQTFDDLLLSTAFFTLFCVVLVTCNTGKRCRLVLWALVISGLIQALYGSLMVLSGIEFGFLTEKWAYKNTATGTFVNRNHFAGYMELSLAAGIGLLLADLGQSGSYSLREILRNTIDWILSPKFLLRVFLAIMVIALVLSRSRMGNAAFFSALCLCGMGYILVRERRLALKAAILFASLLIIDLWIVSSWFGLEQVVERLQDTTDSGLGVRDPVFADFIPIIDAYWLTGSGLGSFSVVYPGFRSPEVTNYFDHAHNDYAQFLIETGLPGFMIIAMLVLGTLLHSVTVIIRRRNRLACGISFSALMAMTAIMIHSFVDFNLQIPANAATLVILMALCWCVSSNSSGKRRRKRIPVLNG